MRMTRRAFLISALILAVALPVAAQDRWPSRTITIVGGFPTGAGTDIYSRMLAEPLSKALACPSSWTTSRAPAETSAANSWPAPGRTVTPCTSGRPERTPST